MTQNITDHQDPGYYLKKDNTIQYNKTIKNYKDVVICGPEPLSVNEMYLSITIININKGTSSTLKNNITTDFQGFPAHLLRK